MAKTRRAYTGGAVSTTTSSNIAASGTTSFTVAAATGWPYGSDPFFVVVEPGTASEEKILVTRAGSGDTTINIASDARRGQDGTVAVSHSNGATVFPVFTALDADEANELASKWTTKGDLVSYGSSTFERLGVGTNDHVLTAASGETSGLKWGQVATGGIADGAVTGAKLAQGYTYVQTVYFTSSGTFTKATYPWLRRVKITAVGGGGAGGGVTAVVDVGGGGGGSGGAVVLELDASSLAASETVTIGAGGVGVVGGNGGNGGDTTFGSHLTAGGGVGGLLDNGASNALPGAGGTASSTGLNLGGDAGGAHSYWGTTSFYGLGGKGGSAPLGGGGGRGNTNGNGLNGSRGGGGGGGGNAAATTARVGGNGGNGYVIVELFA